MRRPPFAAAPLLALLAALTALAAVAGPASAGSFSLPTGLGEPTFAGGQGAGSEGPVLAGGGRVVWVEPRGTGAALVVAGADGTRTDALRLPPFRSLGSSWQRLEVLADGDRAVVQRVGFSCPGSGNRCTGDDRRVASDLVAVDLVTDAARPLDGCLGDAACATCSGDPWFTGFDLQLSGDALAVGGCVDGLLDLATGAVTRLAKGAVIALAGSRAVLGTPQRGTVRATHRLADWRTGALVRSLPGFTRYGDDERQIALAADGTVAYTTLGGIETIGPGGARRVLRRKPGEEEIAQELLFAGPLLAEWRVERSNGSDDRAWVRIRRPDGTGARTVVPQLVGGGWSAADGRVAWAVRPCAQTVVQVWDLAGPPPAPAPDLCTLGRLSTAPVRLTRGGRLPIAVTCPPAPAQGCAGDVLAELRPAAGRREVGETFLTPYEVPAGTTRTLNLQFPGDQRPPARLRRFVARVALDTRSAVDAEGLDVGFRQRVVHVPVRR